MTEKKTNNKAIIKWLLILGLVLIIFLFALQNSKEVKLSLVFTKTMTPLSAIMIACLLLGFLVGIFLMRGLASKHRKKAKVLQGEVERLHKRLELIQDKMLHIDDELNQD